MLTYVYALICDPCERTACDLFAYVEAHPGCLMALDPDDFENVHRVMDERSLGQGCSNTIHDPAPIRLTIH
jgi:hypothetical protein